MTLTFSTKQYQFHNYCAVTIPPNHYCITAFETYS